MFTGTIKWLWTFKKKETTTFWSKKKWIMLFCLLGVPKVTFQNLEFSVSLFSKLEINATVHNISNIPLTTVIKWQKNDEDINITDTRYIGSTEDLVAPKLVINGVNFNEDHGQYYCCVATNSEGLWIASAKINVHDSMYVKILHFFNNMYSIIL